MKLLVWLIMMYNRKWQRQFDAITAQFNEPDTNHKFATKYESEAETPTKEEIMEAINSQPTHLSNRKCWARPSRKYHKKGGDNHGIESPDLDQTIN